MVYSFSFTKLFLSLCSPLIEWTKFSALTWRQRPLSWDKAINANSPRGSADLSHHCAAWDIPGLLWRDCREQPSIWLRVRRTGISDSLSDCDIWTALGTKLSNARDDIIWVSACFPFAWSILWHCQHRWPISSTGTKDEEDIRRHQQHSHRCQS